MFSKTLASIALLAFALAPPAAAHGLVTAVKGANGVTSAGFGVDASTPRNGATPTPFEQDTSVIRDKEIASGKAGPCGRTKLGGVNDVAAQLSAASAAGLATAAADGTVSMTLHQVNQDGAGPYACDVSADGTGADFVKMQVAQNVPGFAGLSLTAAKDFTLTAQMPAGVKCSGGPNGDACIVRCRNQALAGPFGGCVAVGNADGAAAGKAATGTTAAAGADTATAATDASAAAAAAAGKKAVAGTAAGGKKAAAAGTAAARAANDAAKGGNAIKKLFGGQRRRFIRSRVSGQARWI